MVRLMIRALLVLIVLITAGCNLPGLFSPQQDDRLIPDTGAPWVLIHDPPNGFTAELNVPLLVHSTASDAVGIARIDLLVDGVLARSDETPDGIALLEFSLLQPWIPDQIGDYDLAVIAYRSDGTPSEAAQVAVRVAEAGAVAAAGPDESKACVATALTVLNIRQGPGVRYPIEGSLLIGQKGHVTGRNADGTWWQIDINGGPGWISALHALAEGECDQVAEAAAPPPPAGATPVYRTPVPVNQAGEAPLREANTTGWTFWEVIVDVWVQIFGPGLDDDPGYPPPATPSEGYPPPSATTPAGSTSTNSPEGYPPPATDEPDGDPPPATGTPAGYPAPPKDTQPVNPPLETQPPEGYPPPENTIIPGYPYPPPEATRVQPSATLTSYTVTATNAPSTQPPPTAAITDPPTPTDPPPPTQAPSTTPEPTSSPAPTAEPTVEPTAVPTATDEPTVAPWPTAEPIAESTG